MSRADDIKRIFSYCPESGQVTASVYHGAVQGIPRKAGWITTHGYLRFQCGARQEYAHVIACVFIYGDIPEKPLRVDHIDGDRLNNRASNLRLVDANEHCANRNKNKNGSSGRKGVTWDKRKSLWKMQIQYRGKRIAKLFQSLDDAADYYDLCALNFDAEHFAINKNLHSRSAS